MLGAAQIGPFYMSRVEERKGLAATTEYDRLLPKLLIPTGGPVLEEVEDRLFGKAAQLKTIPNRVTISLDLNGTTIEDEPYHLLIARGIIRDYREGRVDTSRLKDSELRLFFEIEQLIGDEAALHNKGVDEAALMDYIRRRGPVEFAVEPELYLARDRHGFGNGRRLVEQTPFPDMASMTRELTDIADFVGNTGLFDTPTRRLAYDLLHDHQGILISRAHMRSPTQRVQVAHKVNNIRRYNPRQFPVFHLEDNSDQTEAITGEGAFVVLRDHQKNLNPFLEDGPMVKRYPGKEGMLDFTRDLLGYMDRNPWEAAIRFINDHRKKFNAPELTWSLRTGEYNPGINKDSLIEKTLSY